MDWTFFTFVRSVIYWDHSFLACYLSFLNFEPLLFSLIYTIFLSKTTHSLPEPVHLLSGPTTFWTAAVAMHCSCICLQEQNKLISKLSPGYLLHRLIPGLDTPLCLDLFFLSWVLSFFSWNLSFVCQYPPLFEQLLWWRTAASFVWKKKKCHFLIKNWLCCSDYPTTGVSLACTRAFFS